MLNINIDGKDYSYDSEDVWLVEIGKGSKGKYQARYSLDTPHQGMRYFNGVNIGNGYKKRLVLVRVENVTFPFRTVICKAAS